MKYFENIATLDDLKKAYRHLAMIHHPDIGGDTATMQEINAEYDRLFPVYKLAYNQKAETPTHETAESTRSEFYTQPEWVTVSYHQTLDGAERELSWQKNNGGKNLQAKIFPA